ncbi:MAG: radical SAM family heme chaperone HemW [Peptostreptococcaceae bacterium]|nr:radical SAM family heme chaperone HemW [Peptostreptococcaceae bacterium]
MKKLSIYIHIPFCVKKCAYCDFISFRYNGDAAKAYKTALFSEIDHYSDLFRDYEIKSIFVGGGTPSLMSEDFHEKLLGKISGMALIGKNAEITMEANPDSILERDTERLRSAGYNRLSIGMQSFDDALLKKVGRIHDSRQSRLAFEHARRGGFNNISIDLMYGLPGQKMNAWERDIVIAADELSPEHISAYSLIVNRNTPMQGLLEKSPELFPEDGEERDMHHLCTDMLRDRGYHQYEISNYSKAGFESLHNKIYWERGEYLGLGVAAHSFIGSRRFSNTNEMDDYIEKTKNGGSGVALSEILTERDALFEEIFLGLRMTKGIDMGILGKKYEMDFWEMFRETINSLKDNGIVTVENERLLLTRRGVDISNGVFLEFLKVIDQKY